MINSNNRALSPFIGNLKGEPLQNRPVGLPPDRPKAFAQAVSARDILGYVMIDWTMADQAEEYIDA
jgi:hypothetical protein